MDLRTPLYHLLKKHCSTFAPVVPFDAGNDNLLHLDFSAGNVNLTSEILFDTNAFSKYIEELLGEKYMYGIGGYDEHRTIYSRSNVFDGEEEPRRLHLGIDIWGKASTPIFAPLDAQVHSFAFNDYYGDYGATIILLHQLDGVAFHTLYGHLSLRDIEGLHPGQIIKKGTGFAHFGEPIENGHWPPHLHFQVVESIGEMKGDYPGVCKFSERERYLINSPDPDTILGMMPQTPKGAL